LLHAVLQKSGRVALAKVALRDRTRLALVRARAGLFSLDTMHYADELIDPREGSG
jgi:DNA end-binding protein Ku